MGFTNVKNGAATLIDTGKGSFGEQLVATPFPTAQGGFTSGINPQIFVTSSLGDTAAVTVANGIVTASCGTTVSGSADVQLRRNVKYRPGQLVECRFTAVFDPGVEARHLRIPAERQHAWTTIVVKHHYPAFPSCRAHTNTQCSVPVGIFFP